MHGCPCIPYIYLSNAKKYRNPYQPVQAAALSSCRTL
ncbi:hypothetical protein 2200_scaffold1335_00073 [Bacteriophage sp.]|nr:hypothetical protein 2200_scaffold1335_00073 [Bacteriophage sp.]